MKRAHRDESTAGATSDGAPIVPGALPSRKDTVQAEVLMRLLSGEQLTALDAVADASTTRLAAVVHVLREVYGWNIEKVDRAAGCRDGRVSWVAQYRLPRELLSQVDEPRFAFWCREVQAARAFRRQQAPQARKLAARLNDAGRRAVVLTPAQHALFEGGPL